MSRSNLRAVVIPRWPFLTLKLALDQAMRDGISGRTGTAGLSELGQGVVELSVRCVENSAPAVRRGSGDHHAPSAAPRSST